MPAKPVSLGPWSGIDNVHSPDARTFQPPGDQERRLAALVSAMDVDLDDDGDQLHGSQQRQFST